MTKPVGISAEAAHEKIASGNALLVCAYADEEACRKVQLEGSINLVQFASRLGELPVDQEIIFYCA
jgi:hypothetical protein